MNEIAWQVGKIIDAANELQLNGNTGASTGEQIAAAFVLNNMDYLPAGFTITEAWSWLGSWQAFVLQIRRDYMHLVNNAPATRS